VKACSLRRPSKSKKYEHIVLALKRAANVDNPFAVAQSTYRKLLARRHKMLWVRHVRDTRTLASFAIKSACLESWGRKFAQNYDLIIVYDPANHTTQTLEWTN
jgi:hypothetical protein